MNMEDIKSFFMHLLSLLALNIDGVDGAESGFSLDFKGKAKPKKSVKKEQEEESEEEEEGEEEEESEDEPDEEEEDESEEESEQEEEDESEEEEEPAGMKSLRRDMRVTQKGVTELAKITKVLAGGVKALSDRMGIYEKAFGVAPAAEAGRQAFNQQPITIGVKPSSEITPSGATTKPEAKVESINTGATMVQPFDAMYKKGEVNVVKTVATPMPPTSAPEAPARYGGGNDLIIGLLRGERKAADVLKAIKTRAIVPVAQH